MNCVSCGNASGDGLLCAKCATFSEDVPFSRYTLIGDTIFTEARKESAVLMTLGPSIKGNVTFENLPDLSDDLDLVEEGLETGRKSPQFVPRVERIMLHTGIPEELEVGTDLLISKEGAEGANRLLAITEDMRQDKKVNFSPRMENLLGNAAWLCNPITCNPRALDLDFRGDVMMECSEKVLSYYDNALSGDPSNTAALRNRAIVLHAVSREKDSIEACDEYLKKEPKDSEVWSLKGSALMNVGENEDALRSYDKALRLSPKNHYIWTEKGLALLGLGKYPESIMCFEHSINLEEHNPEAHDGKGDALTKLGQIDTAVEAYDKAKSFIPRPTFITKHREIIEEKVETLPPPDLEETVDIDEPELEDELIDDVEAEEEEFAEEKGLTIADEIEEPEIGEIKPKSLAEALAGGFDDDEEDEFPEFVDIPSKTDEKILPNEIVGLRPELDEEAEPEEDDETSEITEEMDDEASEITEEIDVEELKMEEELEDAFIEEPEIDEAGSEDAMSKMQELIDEEDYDGALEYCNSYLERYPKDNQVLAMRGGLLLSLGRTDEALKTFDKSLGIDPDDSLSLINKAQAFYEADDYDAAIQTFDKVLENDPKNLDALLGKGRSQVEVDKFEDAIVSFNAVIELDKENVDAWLGIGDGFFGLDRADDAYKCYEKVSDFQPDEAEAWAKKADVLVFKGRWGGALQFYNRAISLDEEYVYPYIRKGLLLMERRKFDEANKAFTEVLKSEPTNPDALCGRSEILIKKGKWGAALQNLKDITRLHSKHSKAWALTGDAYRMDGHIEDAKEAYDNALDFDPKSSGAMVGKGLLMLKHGGYNESVKLFRKALKHNPEDSSIWRHLGNAQKEVGKEKEAIRSLEKAVEMGDHITENWLSLGIALHEIGRYADAINSFDRLLKLKPDFDEAKRWREQAIKRLGRGP